MDKLKTFYFRKKLEWTTVFEFCGSKQDLGEENKINTLFKIFPKIAQGPVVFCSSLG